MTVPIGNYYGLQALQSGTNARLPTVLPRPDRAHAFEQAAQTGPAFKNRGTTLQSETEEELTDGGTRRTQVFEREDGRRFTRVEDFTLTDNGARRVVYQQNPSGSLSQYEEILNREPSGTFRRTQRFTDGTGETGVEITNGYKVTDAFVLSGGFAARGSANPFTPMRGTQLDLSA